LLGCARAVDAEAGLGVGALGALLVHALVVLSGRPAARAALAAAHDLDPADLVGLRLVAGGHRDLDLVRPPLVVLVVGEAVLDRVGAVGALELGILLVGRRLPGLLGDRGVGLVGAMLAGRGRFFGLAACGSGARRRERVRADAAVSRHAALRLP